MENNNMGYVIGGTSLLDLILVVNIVLKLCGVITWSWGVVFWPLWVSLASLLLIVIIVIVSILTNMTKIKK